VADALFKDIKHGEKNQRILVAAVYRLGTVFAPLAGSPPGGHWREHVSGKKENAS
jgi:hypothetical protein